VSKALYIVVAASAGALLGAGLMVARGVSAGRPAPAGPALAAAPAARATLLDEVLARIRSDYVDGLPATELDRAAAAGMVSSLDPHSAFLDAAQYQAMRASTAGHYSGIGIEVAERDGHVVVVTPIAGSPAAVAGLRAGDVLLAVDGVPVAVGTLDDALGRLRGRTGSTVRLEVGRAGEPGPLRFEIERSDVHVNTVAAERLPGAYGYLRVAHFNDATPQDLRLALSELQAEGALRGLVLDLRGNPGGVLESAVSVADDFLDSGVIVRAEGRAAGARFALEATEGDLLRSAPLVVLVDRGSASGAEIVAGALRDHGRATLMGERTFGKGSVQTVIPLRDGQALKLTTSRYYTPSGDSLHERGLDPDVRLGDALGSGVVAPGAPAGADPAVQAAAQYLRDRGLGRQVALAEQP
jgi:carboxyl-terminal processing protease